QWAQYSLMVEIAERLSIPVMLNAQNIQKYDSSDWRCRFLTKHAKSEVVKYITSRDGQPGADRLRKDYRIPDRIVCAGVGDSAFWIPQCYDVRIPENRDTIGINIIEGTCFVRYGNHLKSEELLKVYVDLLKALDKKGQKWELFTNGLPQDHEFAREVLAKYGKPEIKVRIPSSDKDLVNIIAGYKGVVGGRLHSCIGSYAEGIPFVGFVWDEKMIGFGRMVGLGDYFFTKDELTGQGLCDKVLEACDMDLTHIHEIREHWKQENIRMVREFLSQV
ncbi:MAG: polysaccharide pyruvyl transferase family protein, partial [Lachnospiraceae bacterium]|nr:polysaccharide pyruvyl transferase family protein [Lachnospiraceae bacterium]